MWAGKSGNSTTSEHRTHLDSRFSSVFQVFMTNLDHAIFKTVSKAYVGDNMIGVTELLK